eukprot:TRINITY_DN220_c0_g1_i1.p1 TRINITY_DN220_c0_g1~~TRINITY_DN220_c0_g1_i1.p1  ORF type:complete len:206 (-),score=84.28 TRINITY_DN220_c0_g1_i1:404-1021(-)
MAQEQTGSEAPATTEVPKAVVEEKPATEAQPATAPEGPQPTSDDSKALAIVEAEKSEHKKEAIAETVVEDKEKSSEGGSLNRDTVLAKVNTEKKVALIKAWEENEKAKAENKFYKSISNITAWENTKKSSAETRLRKKEEQLEKKKAAYVEKMKNEIAVIHRKADEKKAMAEAKRGEEILKAEETAAKYRAAGEIPKNFCMCFGG